MGKPGTVRIGNSFTLAEAIHHSRLLEAILTGRDMATIRRMAQDPLSANVQRKFVSMRDIGRARLKAFSEAGVTGMSRQSVRDADGRIPYELTGKAARELSPTEAAVNAIVELAQHSKASR